MKTLYVTDLDGTLLNNGSFVSAETSEIISELTDDGALITVATARTPATVVPLMEGTHTVIPYVVITGAALFDPLGMQYVMRRTIPPGDCDFLDSLFAATGVKPFIYHFTGRDRLVVYHDRDMSQNEFDFYYPRRDLILKKFTFEKNGLSNRDILFYFATGMKEEIFPLADAVAASARFSVSCYPDIYSAGMMLLEIFPFGVSKADAIKRLYDEVGADRLVTFGDNLNDIPMFEISDLAVAVGNAQPRVKDRADIVIGPNYDNSVARFILEDYYR